MNTIILTGTDLVTSSAADEARAKRDDLLILAQNIPSIVDADSALLATERLRNLRSFYKEIVVGKDDAKGPVLEIGRKIDALFHELADEIEAEGTRIGGLLGAYNVEQERIAQRKREDAAREERRIREEAAKKEREAELARLHKEQQAREHKMREEEDARRERDRKQREIDREAEEKAARARTDAGRERAAQEAEKRKAELAEQERKDKEERDRKAEEDRKERERVAAEEQKKRDEEEARRVAANRESVAVATAKPKGTATSMKVCYEIEDIVKLYEAAPYLCNVTENGPALKNAIKNLRGDQKLPGVRHWLEASTITRG